MHTPKVVSGSLKIRIVKYLLKICCLLDLSLSQRDPIAASITVQRTGVKPRLRSFWCRLQKQTFISPQKSLSALGF